PAHVARSDPHVEAWSASTLTDADVDRIGIVHHGLHEELEHRAGVSGGDGVDVGTLVVGVVELDVAVAVLAHVSPPAAAGAGSASAAGSPWNWPQAPEILSNFSTR